MTQKALKILDETRSVKRLGIVLAENFIARDLLSQNTDEIETRLKDHLANVGLDELNQIKFIYKNFKERRDIKSLEFLEDS